MSEERAGFIKKSYLLLRYPIRGFKVLSRESDYLGLLVYGGLIVILICIVEYVRYTKIINCLSAVFGGNISETTRGILISNILPMLFFILISLSGYFLTIVAIAYLMNRYVFKKRIAFSLLISSLGYIQLYMLFFTLATLVVALIMPSLYNVTVYPGTYGVVGALIRDYASQPEIQSYYIIGQTISKSSYLVITAIFLTSLRWINKNNWEEILIMSFLSVPIYLFLWGL